MNQDPHHHGSKENWYAFRFVHVPDDISQLKIYMTVAALAPPLSLPWLLLINKNRLNSVIWALLYRRVFFKFVGHANAHKNKLKLVIIQRGLYHVALLVHVVRVSLYVFIMQYHLFESGGCLAKYSEIKKNRSF